MQLVLDGDSWRAAGLASDDDAKRWFNEVCRDRGLVFWAELVAEGQLNLWHTLRGGIIVHSSCTCPNRLRCHERDDGIVTVRRRYTGSVPPQVLAAFQPEP